MNNLGEFPEGGFARVFRYFAYFLFGGSLGCGPAAWFAASFLTVLDVHPRQPLRLLSGLTWRKGQGVS
jgi:hypothetical protein